MDLPHDIGARIRDARHAIEMPQQVLAVRLGIATSALQRWESGGSVKAHHLVPIAEALGVSVEWLVLGDGTAAGAA